MSSRTPYRDQPEHAFWRQAVATPPCAEVDPVAGWTLTIDRDTRIATAGSCFAQHIANRLARSGFTYMMTEPPHPAVAADLARTYNYGLFTARFGNIYTSRQLLQLIERAYGRFQPEEDVWVEADGRLIDPFRPNVQPGGFVTRAEYDLARRQHFAAVRRMVEEVEVFVFTLGLTECWTSRADGAVFPLCPGVSGGTYDPDRHVFRNLGVEEVTADMRAVLARLRAVNPSVRMILTVSPVPLIATAGEDHVLAATTYSKSVLRVAAEELRRSEPGVHYFPSYEVITGAHARGAYLGGDLREVEEAGVNHVMRLFFRHAAPGIDVSQPRARAVAAPSMAVRRMRQALNVICDENSIETAVQDAD